MVLSYFVYTLFALSLYALGKELSNREMFVRRMWGRELGFFSWEIVLSILIFASISGVRYNVGVDHLSYLETYTDYLERGGRRDERLEPLFILITQAFASLGLHFAWYFGFLAAIQIFFLYFAFRHNKRLLPYIGLVVILGPYYLRMMNGIRQEIVACAFVFLVEWIDKKKLLPFVIAVFVLSLIHKSVFILLPVYFLLNAKVDFGKRWINLAILTVCVILGSTPTWLNMINSINPLLEILGYGGYADNMEHWVDEMGKMTWGPLRISSFVVGCFIVWHYKHLKAYFSNDNKLRMYFMLFFIGICAYNLFANTSHIFLRPVGYFTIFQLPLTAYLLHYLLKNEKLVQFSVFLVLACAYTYIAVLKAGLMPSVLGDMSLYKFFWDCI